MFHHLARAARFVGGAAVLGLSLAFTGCGGGGGSGGAFLSIEVDNNALSAHAVVQREFSFIGLSLLPNKIDPADIAPGFGADTAFSEYESDNLFDLTITWDDFSTTYIPLVLFAGTSGTLTYPVTH